MQSLLENIDKLKNNKKEMMRRQIKLPIQSIVNDEDDDFGYEL